VRHVRMLGLCLVAALAVAAIGASSAFAGAEWGKCEHVGSGGNYTGPNCTKAEKAKPKGTGSYEWRKASEVAAKRVAEGKSANVPFSGESVGGGGLLTTSLRECWVEPTGGITATRQGCAEAGGEEHNYGVSEPITVECSKENNTGETEGKAGVANVAVVFKGCVVAGYLPCESEGAEEGEVVTNALKGKLGYISKSAGEVGVLLEPVAHHGSFAEFNCSGIIFTDVGVGNDKVGTEYVQGTNYPTGCYGAHDPGRGEVGCPLATPAEEKHGGYDGIISPITPVNQMTNKFTQVYTQEAGYPFRNIPTHFERKHLDVLEDVITVFEGEESGKSAWTAAGEVITNVNTPEEEGEIKA
jgi:hypothetical protein